MVVTTTAAGQLQGLEIDGVQVFRGVPYAAPPVGPLRFRPPAPHPTWSGVRDATSFGSVGWQEPTPLETLNGTHLRTQDEGCLTLNVWTPACDDNRRPVLVWIHGGSYLSGSGACEAYDGTSFATTHDVVVVTINYRLNVFGYLHLEDLSPDEVGSGSCGLLDQIAALTWVRDNIAAFGGDPGQVTVAGESAGAMSVGCLLGAPASYGLFHGAVMQSGAPLTQTLDGAKRVTAGVLAELGIPADSAAPNALRAVPPDVLLKAAAGASTQRMLDEGEAASGFSFAPVMGTSVVPQDPFVAVAEGAVRGVPLLIGTDLDELQVMEIVMPDLLITDENALAAQFAAIFGARADEAAEVYARANQDGTLNTSVAVQGDGMFLLPAIRLAEAQRGAGGEAWMFLFAWRTTARDGRLGAFHTLEIPFVFHTLDRGAGPEITDGPPAQVRPLADTMHAAWAQFARDGDPGWPHYDVESRPTMVFDVESRVVDDPMRERRTLWAASIA